MQFAVKAPQESVGIVPAPVTTVVGETASPLAGLVPATVAIAAELLLIAIDPDFEPLFPAVSRTVTVTLSGRFPGFKLVTEHVILAADRARTHS